MSAMALDDLIACQTRLLAAIDARDPAAIEAETSKLETAVQTVRGLGVWHDPTMSRPKIEYALKQTEAARTRVRILAGWTRQRLERLSEIRSGSTPRGYPKSR